jgi:quercetin dioxygenase-like cupin family protein
MSGVELYDWNTVPSERLSPEITRQAIHRANMTLARIEIVRHATVATHSHVHEQVTMVEKGALKYVVDGVERVVRAGEMIAVAPNVPHGVVDTLEDTVVLDFFSPAREDWPRSGA